MGVFLIIMATTDSGHAILRKKILQLQDSSGKKDRKLLIAEFEQFFFSSNPEFNSELAFLLLRGSPKNGLVEMCGAKSWKRRGKLKVSSAMALGLLLRLLNYQRKSDPESPLRNISSFDDMYIF